MFTDSLERAIKLLEQGKSLEAQKVLKRLIAADHHNLPAWFWFVKTCSTNKQRLNVLEICLEYNPDSEQVKQALAELQLLSRQNLPARPLEITQNNSKLFTNHIVLLVSTFGIAFIIATLLSIGATYGPFWALGSLPIGLLFIPIFPIGLIAVFDSTYKDNMPIIPIVIGWLAYFVVFLFGTFIKKRSVFNFIYFVFIMLLIMNIVGCMQFVRITRFCGDSPCQSTPAPLFAP